MDLNLEGLSTEAKIGKVLVIIALILKVLGIIGAVAALSLGGAYFSMFLPMAGLGAGLWMGMVAAIVIVSLIGIFLVWKSLGKMTGKDFHGAAIFALIAAFLPPLDIIVLIGAILLFLSPEAKKAGVPKEAKPAKQPAKPKV